MLVNESGKTLERIVAAVKSVSDIIAEIATRLQSTVERYRTGQPRGPDG